MSQQTPVGPVTWVLTPTDLGHLEAAVGTAALVVLDLETTGLYPWATRGGPLNGGYPARVVLAALTLPQVGGQGEPTTWVLPLSHPASPWLGRWREVLRRVCRAVQDQQRPLANQNVKFDAKWIYAHTGVDLSTLIVWDTQVSSHLLDEIASTKLKERAPATFGIARWDDDMDFTVPGAAERADIYALGEYAARDTYWTWRLLQRHRQDLYLRAGAEPPQAREEVTDARLGRVATWVSMPTVATLTEVEQRGIGLDVDWVRERLATEQQIYRTTMDEQIAGRYGLPTEDASIAATANWFQAFTQAAVAAGDLQVAALTPTGVPQWSKGVLLRQARAGSAVAEAVLRARAAKKLSEYLSSWLDHVGPDGRIHTTYNVGSVVTGRLSSSEPNMQQITKVLRPAFIPSPGHVIVDLDYSQIELRVAAFISRCQPMIDAFGRGDDLHRLLAARITGKAPDDVTPVERQAGKSANFGLLYGMGALGFQEYAETVYGVSVSVDEAQVMYLAYFATWDGMAQWHARTVGRAQRDGYVTSPIGRVRRLPDIWDGNPKIASHAERNAINSPVQGFASDLMQMAAASIAGKLPGHTRVPGAALVATVHDSIVLEAPQECWRQVAQACRERMTHAVLEVLDRRLECRLDVPLVADIVAGTRWGWSDVSAPTT